MNSQIIPFDPRRRVGSVIQVYPDSVLINLNFETQFSGRLLEGEFVVGGQVGDFIVIEADSSAILTRILEVKLPERERMQVEVSLDTERNANPIAKLHLLGTLDIASLKVTAGVVIYPMLGAPVYSASSSLLTYFCNSTNRLGNNADEPCLELGSVQDGSGTLVQLGTRQLLGRHCAILGTTGGGKSTTVSRIVQQLTKINCKILLLDPSGEYPPIGRCRSLVLGHRKTPVSEESAVHIPYSQLEESDLYALFSPSGKSQGPKLRDAIRNLRHLNILEDPQHAAIKEAFISDGLIKTTRAGVLHTWKNPKKNWRNAVWNFRVQIEDPSTPFEIKNLSAQIFQECVFPDDFNSADHWGKQDESAVSYCLSLATRIDSILKSPALRSLFEADNSKNVFEELSLFLASTDQVLKISLDVIPADFSAREILVHMIGKNLLKRARNEEFKSSKPLLVVLDEAHNFLNKRLGDQESPHPLDAFDKLAKEGRKYWLNLLLATQQPRDIPPGILSQMGTLVVHRLINEADRSVVEAACGQLDAAAARFLPSLAPGEAAIIGVDLPIPLTIQIEQPDLPYRPNSSGPDYNKWS